MGLTGKLGSSSSRASRANPSFSSRQDFFVEKLFVGGATNRSRSSAGVGFSDSPPIPDFRDDGHSVAIGLVASVGGSKKLRLGKRRPSKLVKQCDLNFPLVRNKICSQVVLVHFDQVEAHLSLLSELEKPYHEVAALLLVPTILLFELL